MDARKLLAAIALCLTTTLAHGAGLRAIDIPAGAEGPALTGAMWYPCPVPPGLVEIEEVLLAGRERLPAER